MLPLAFDLSLENYRLLFILVRIGPIRVIHSDSLGSDGVFALNRPLNFGDIPRSQKGFGIPRLHCCSNFRLFRVVLCVQASVGKGGTAAAAELSM
ncbi:hypothetical protein CEXT_231891 [Caerostris extrusa]|uniref:Uncharacterized protein n=1 Tax=Caerostris extrusa TaxID=172846 RepID=A0AAV4UN72_CAEEX|nr:hypothetical protein CEXT_231891 [Caerostris extrusa]